MPRGTARHARAAPQALFGHFKPGVDFIGLSAGQADGHRRLKRLGPNDWLVVWEKGCNPSRWPPQFIRLALAREFTVRIVRGSCSLKGFRVCRVTPVTTLLDAEAYPARQILQANLRRWRLEICLDDLKMTLEMQLLCSRTPPKCSKRRSIHI